MNQFVEHPDQSVEFLAEETRAEFITRTYLHLVGAVASFVALEWYFLQSGLAERMFAAMAGRWMLILGGFMVVSWIASRVAHTVRSLPLQYLALGGFVLAESIIFAPLIFMASMNYEGLLTGAVTVTAIGFVGLTMIAFMTRKDFSFLGGLVWFGLLLGAGAIVASLIFGFTLGLWFSVAMVAVAGGAILYDTSNVIHHYPEDRYVAASLELFSSVALLLWYVIRIFMFTRD